MSKDKKPKSKIFINKEFCKGCGFCVEFCKKGVLVLSNSYCDSGYHFPEVIKNNCVGCYTCEIVCPDFAIKVEKL